MSAGRLQLAISGKETLCFTQNPEITFFKTKYNSFSNFSMDVDEINFQPNVNFGLKVDGIIPKDADLLTNVYVVVKLPTLDSTFEWNDDIAHNLIESCEFSIGSVAVDKFVNLSLEINSQINLTENELLSYKKQIHEKSNTLYIHLPFWFSKTYGSALPLLCIASPIKVAIKFRNINELTHSNDGTTLPKNNPYSLQAWLLIKTVYLDNMERKLYNQPREYLINQTQYLSSRSISNVENMVRINLPFNKAVYQIAWVVQRTDILEKKYVSIEEENVLVEMTNILSAGNHFLWTFPYSTGINVNMKKDSFRTCKFLINNTDRTKELDASYFRLIENAQHNGRIPDTNIYSYNFGLENIKYQPTGFLNCSNCGELSMILTFENSESPVIVNLVAKNYNILKIEKGHSKLKF